MTEERIEKWSKFVCPHALFLQARSHISKGEEYLDHVFSNCFRGGFFVTALKANEGVSRFEVFTECILHKRERVKMSNIVQWYPRNI